MPMMPEPMDPLLKEIKSTVLGRRRAARVDLPHHVWFKSRLGDSAAVEEAIAATPHTHEREWRDGCWKCACGATPYRDVWLRNGKHV